MIVTYRPADGPEQVWNFHPDQVRVAAAEIVENRAGMRFEEWVMETLAGRAKARRILLWHLRCREHPHLRLEDAPDFAMGELNVERDLDELLAFREQISKSAIDPEIRDAALVEVEVEIATQRAAASEDGDDEAGKALSPNGSTVTALTSPASSI